MTSTNLNIVLTNALCCSANLAAKVSKLYSIGDKCADAELAKLKLLNDYIETLRCYNVDGYVNSKFSNRIAPIIYDTYFKGTSNINYNYVITINGITLSALGDGITTVTTLFRNLLLSNSDIISVDFIIDPNLKFNIGYAYFNIEALCNINTVSLSIIKNIGGDVYIDEDFAQIQTGICEVTNCLTDEEYQTLIEYVMSTCNICECQLTQ